MASSPLPIRPDHPPHPLAPFAGFLSYLIPGLGQISQGRIGKGLLFLVCIYALFFYGVYLGSGEYTTGGRTYRISSNVYLPDTVEEINRDRGLPPLAQNLYNRPQFAGQFWVGIAAWPAIAQYLHYDRREAGRAEGELYELYRDLPSEEGTDPQRAAEIRQKISQIEQSPALRHPWLGVFMREPTQEAVNAVTNASDKRLELAWVYTVIAGVLNILVIYDAVAGPAFGSRKEDDPPSAGDPQKKD